MPALLLVGGFAFAFTLAESRLPRLVSFESSPAGAEAVASGKADGFNLSPAAVRVVPAKLITSAEPVRTQPVSFRTVMRPKKNARISSEHRDVPMLLRTSTRARPQLAPAVLVMMRTQEFEGPNSTRWTLCVWRVVVIAPAQRPIESGISAKTT
jgi:hypothetical protein